MYTLVLPKKEEEERGRKKNLFLLDAFALGEPLADGRDGLWAGATVGRWFAEGFFLEGELCKASKISVLPFPFSNRPGNGTLVANTADTVAVAWRARDSPNRRKSAPYRRHISLRPEQHFGGFLLPPTLEGERKRTNGNFYRKGGCGRKKASSSSLVRTRKGGKGHKLEKPPFPLPPPSPSFVFPTWKDRKSPLPALGRARNGETPLRLKDTDSP